MSDYLQALGFIHAGKDWSFNASNVLTDIKIDTRSVDSGGIEAGAGSVNHNEFVHLVFKIPRTKMRSNAATFGDWRNNEEGSQESHEWKLIFCWFMEYVYRIGKSDPAKNDKRQDNGDGVFIFFEVVKTPTGGIAGERIHAFIRRGKPMLGTIFKSMLETASRKDNTKKNLFKPWDYHHRHVKTKEEYILNVVDKYKGDTIHSDLIYESSVLLVDKDFNTVAADMPRDHRHFKASPLNIFSLDNFTIEGAQDCQNDKSQYMSWTGTVEEKKYTGIAKFPLNDLIVKRFWHQIELSYIWNKYIPSHQYTWVDLPEIHCSRNARNPLQVDVFLKECPTRCIIEEFMNGIGKPAVNDAWMGLKGDEMEKLRVCATGRFIILEPLEEPHAVKLGVNGWVTGFKRYGAAVQSGYGAEGMEYTDRLKSKYQNQHSISAFDLIELETSYRTELIDPDKKREVQELMIDKFERQCAIGDADISDVGKGIARWLIHMKPELHAKFGSFDFEIKDRSLSPFANMQFWFSQALDSYMCVASAHPELIKLHYAVYDAYRQHGINQLHWNMIYTGEGATSKSFVFEAKGVMSIPGTITELTYQTTRADAVDGDQNDHITVFNEAPEGLFAAKGKGEDAQKALSAMKEKLCSNRTRTKTFERDEETGERRNRIAIASQIGCYVGATNDNPADAEEAVKTRFHWGEFAKVHRPDKSISDYQSKAFEMDNKPALKQKYEQFLYYCHDQQMKVFYIWKLIFCQIIRDIDLDAANIVLDGISKAFKKYDIRIPPRTVERYRILCRIMTITNALDMVFNFKGGKHHGDVFELKQLLDVEPYMYCTEEIAICAINMVAVEIPQLSVSRDKTINSLWRLFKRAPNFKKDKDPMSGRETEDYNYIRFTGGRNQLVQKIQHAIPYTEGKPSVHNIHSVLQILSSEPFRASEYKKPPEGSDTSDTVDKFPIKKSDVESHTVAFVSGQNYHDVHMGLFEAARNNQHKSILVDCIKKLGHSYSKERRIVIGGPECINGVIKYPQFMEVVYISRSKKRSIPHIRNSNQESSGVKDMMGLTDDMVGAHDCIVMDTDTDTWAWSRRCISFIGLKTEDAFEYHPDTIKSDIVQSKKKMTYPDNLKFVKKPTETNQEGNEISALQTLGIDLDELRKNRKRKRVTSGIQDLTV